MKHLKFTFLISGFLLMLVNFTFAQWQSDVRLTNAPTTSYTSQSWCIASSGSFVHVVWYDSRDGNSEIYYKRSTDGGTSWGTDSRLTNSTGNSNSPSVTVSGSVVHVVWFDQRNGNNNDEIYYKRSTDDGVSWGADTRLTNNSAFSYNPSIAVFGSVVHVVWYDYRDGSAEIYYKRSIDGGTSWEADTRLTNNSALSENTAVTVSGSVVHVVWYDLRDGNREIYYKRSVDGGTSWGADTRLTNNSAFSYFPSVTVSGSVVHVVWEDDRDGNFEIYYKRSPDGGTSWEADTRLTNNSAFSSLPSVTVSSLVVHVVWRDDRDGNNEIYYKRSVDGGIIWGADTRLTNNFAVSSAPSVTVSGQAVHIVWCDNRDGNFEIYYKRNPTGNVTGITNINSEIPSDFSLSQNYPNPFNPTTKIRLEIPLSRGVSASGGRGVLLVIYDLLGREVATLVNDELNPGSYEVSFDAGKFSSGIYIYKLETDGFSDTKRMVLIK